MSRVPNICIIQARTGSSRLPNKIFLEVQGVSILEYEIRRIRQAKLIDEIVVATTINPRDDSVDAFCKKIKVRGFRGSEDDVLDRFWQCARQYPKAAAIIRISGDCPLVDPKVIDQVVAEYNNEGVDYVSNVLTETFPVGIAVEIFSRTALEKSAREALFPSEREHVTPYIRNRDEFVKSNVSAEQDHSDFRLTLDHPEDFEVIRFLIENSKITDPYLHYVKLLLENPEVRRKNSHIPKNQGLIKSLNREKNLNLNQ